MTNYCGRLEGKNILITGAGSGIGRATAILFANEGANVAVNDINKENAEETARIINKIGQKTLVLIADVTIKEQVKEMVEKYFENFDRLDILVNNAGIGGTFSSITRTTEEIWDRTININLKSVFLVSKYFIRHIKKNDAPKDALRGKIINMASMRGKSGRKNLGAYSASKAGVISLTQTLAQELGPSRITVNAICPGLIHTPIYGNITKEELAGSSLPTCLEKFKPVGDPEDVAKVALFLASSDSDFITGQSIPVSGGQSFV
ncbi:MAG: SDR family oxidoreductase [Candidatus Lokiarchaeota archaeon]|nr:SDR family oxidoreductase [Candidatus Lokiarchaeota archaeon]